MTTRDPVSSSPSCLSSIPAIAQEQEHEHKDTHMGSLWSFDRPSHRGVEPR